MARHVRKPAQVRAVTLVTAARELYLAAQHVDETLQLLNGKVFTPMLDALIKEERRLQNLAISLEDDFLRAASVETGDRLPPLFSDLLSAEAALVWCHTKGIA